MSNKYRCFRIYNCFRIYYCCKIYNCCKSFKCQWSDRAFFLEKNFKRLNNFPSKCYLKRFETFSNFRQLLELNIWTAWTIGFNRHEENRHLCWKYIYFILLFLFYIYQINIFIYREKHFGQANLTLINFIWSEKTWETSFRDTCR